MPNHVLARLLPQKETLWGITYYKGCIGELRYLRKPIITYSSEFMPLPSGRGQGTAWNSHQLPNFTRSAGDNVFFNVTYFEVLIQKMKPATNQSHLTVRMLCSEQVAYHYLWRPFMNQMWITCYVSMDILPFTCHLQKYCYGKPVIIFSQSPGNPIPIRNRYATWLYYGLRAILWGCE
jgi:hypothetical protein